MDCSAADNDDEDDSEDDSVPRRDDTILVLEWVIDGRGVRPSSGESENGGVVGSRL